MGKYYELQYSLLNSELKRDSSGKDYIYNYRTKSKSFDKKDINRYKFACLWTAAASPKNNFNTIDGRISLNNEDLDFVFSSQIISNVYYIFMSSVKSQLETTGNIDPNNIMECLDTFSNYKQNGEIVNRIFKYQQYAEVVKNYGLSLFPNAKKNNEPAMWINDKNILKKSVK